MSSAGNAAGTGAIFGHSAVLRFDGGLTNRGTMALGGGLSDVFGEVVNESGGALVVTGGATMLEVLQHRLTRDAP